MKYNALYIAASFIVFTASCEERELNNPFDRDCPKEVFSPSNLKAEQQGYAVKLTWEQTNINISGFIISRNENDGAMSELARVEKTDTNWYDSNVEGLKKYGYQLIAYAGKNLSNAQSVFLNTTMLYTNGVIAFYPFNGNVNDESGNKRHGVLTNISFVPDRNEKLQSAASFGGDGFIRIPSIGQTNNSFSITLWYMTTKGGTILSTDNIYFGADHIYNHFLASWNIADGTYSPAFNPVYFDNTWHHVAITHDSDKSTIITYFDSVMRHNRPNSGDFKGNNIDIYFGMISPYALPIYSYVTNYYIGSIDDIYFFNRAISASEVEQLYHSSR